MRILIFSTAYLPFIGGAEIAVKEITSHLGAHDFDLITARLDKNLSQEEKIGNVNIYRVGFGCKTIDKFLLPIFGFLKARKLNKNNKYDLIWSMMASQGSIAASFFEKRCRIKLVLTLQEGDEENHLRRYVSGNDFLYKILIKPWHKLVFEKADRITVISNDLKKRAEKNSGVRVDIIPNGVSEVFLKKEIGSAELGQKRRGLGIEADDFVLIHTGRIVKKNALGDIVEALRYLPIKVKFLQIGDGVEKDELLRLIKKFGLEKRVIFHNFVEQEKLAEFLKISDVFIRPSLSEGLGNSFLEAMAAGIPVIGTPVGGILDFLKEAETGYFCKVSNPESIANKVEHIMGNSKEVQGVISRAKELVINNYSWNKISSEMEQVFLKTNKDV